MENFDPTPYIRDSHKIIDVFGYWPTFHDAEILEVRMIVGDGQPWVPGSESPILEMTVHLFEMTKEVTPEGYFKLRKHRLARLRFENIRDLQLADFWYQNCIFDLGFCIEPMNPPANGSYLVIDISSSVGLSGRFKCQSAQVVSAEPCDEKGMPLLTAS